MRTEDQCCEKIFKGFRNNREIKVNKAVKIVKNKHLIYQQIINNKSNNF